MFASGGSADAQFRTLVAVASPREALAVARGLGGPVPETPWEPIPMRGGTSRPGAGARGTPVDCVLTGVGKAAAAGGVARALDPGIHGAVLSLGVAGSISHPTKARPDGSDQKTRTRVIGDVVFGSYSVFADDGVELGDRVLGLDEMGFGPFPDGAVGVSGDESIVENMAGLIDARGVIATVSAGSGTDACAARVRDRTGALAEAMEGAAVGLVAARLGLRFAELRVISNTTGDRDRQRWDLDLALDVLERVSRALAASRAL